jgi:hypothetical protein
LIYFSVVSLMGMGMGERHEECLGSVGSGESECADVHGSNAYC